MKKVARALLVLAVALGARSAAAGAEEPPAGLTPDDWSRIRRSVEASQHHASRVARPVTVDPTFVHEAQLFGHGDPLGGHSVSVSGDTVVVGTPNDGSAYVFVRSAATWTQQWRLRASSGGGAFGYSVSVSGDTVVVGAPAFLFSGEAGSASVFVRSGTTWTEQQTLLASDGQEDDFFGYSVSVSGDTVAVGAPGDDFPTQPATEDAGSAYVFVRSGTTWTQQRHFATAVAFVYFGSSVSISGDTVVVGAPGDDTAAGADAGSVSVFVRSGTTWTGQAGLQASDGAANDQFGSSVSLSGDAVVVGAPGHDTAATDAGAAYVFVRSGTTWNEQKLLASDGATGDSFGASVSVSGDTAVVGARSDDTAGGPDAGSAYVFVRSGTNWTEQQKILASDGAVDDRFGSSVSVSGDTVIVGTLSPGAESGSAYVFVRSGTWSEQQKLTTLGGTAGDLFGYSVSISGDTVVVGAYGDDTPGGLDMGSAYVFVRSGTTWTEQQKLLPSDETPSGNFGSSVSISGDTVVVGAFEAPTYRGSAYIFVRSGTTWTQQQKLLASDGAAGDFFGISVSVSGDTVVVGARDDDTPAGANAGSAYVFVRSGTTWTEQQKLLASDGEEHDNFAHSVSVSGATVVAGAHLHDTPGGVNAGSAYVFVRSGTTWTEQQQLRASDGAQSDNFGISVSVSGATVVVGALANDGAGGADSGSAYVFVRSGTTWTEQQQLLASDGAAGDFFGYSVSVSGDTAVVGAIWDDTPGGVDSGSAYVFVRSVTTWTEDQKLLAPDAADLDRFGGSVSVSGDTEVVGAAYADTPGGEEAAGSAHVFSGGAAADIAIAITDSPDPVPLGANLVYTIIVTNNGPDAALGVQVALPTPPGLTFVSNTGACTAPFPCALGTVPSGQNRTITATYHVPLGYTGPNPIEATATATATTTDPAPGNNQATALTPVGAASADLQLVKAGPGTVDVGTNIVYTLIIDNFGPSDAPDVQVEDFTPPGLTFVSNTGACTTPFPCALGTVPRAQVRIIIATFHVPSGYAGPNPIVNHAQVSSSVADPVGTNNAASVSTTVIAPNLVPIAIAVDAAGNGVFQPNETVAVAPSWRNAGAAAVANVAGAASNFTGPAGPTYTIADASATYGTIAPSATVSCGADCYRMTNAAATRPAQHWDAAFLEAVTPGASTKTWTLHIGDSFTDVSPSNGFYRFVETILHKNVTGGCTATAYCPANSTTREQMAVFVLVSKEGSGYSPAACGATPMFTDVPPSSPFCRWVEELARRGVVGGCAAGLYCPSAPATREQMAVFVLRTLDPALDPPACGTPVFNDVPASSPFCRWIEELVRRGVVSGCGNDNYCPTDTVTREQMSVFLAVTFGLVLYGL